MPNRSPAKLGSYLKILLVGLVAGVTGCGEGGGNGNRDGGAKLSPALRTDLQAILESAVQNKTTPGAVLHVSAGNGETWSTAAGVSDLGSRPAMAPDERFRAGSIVKTFVATAALQAVEAGELQLDDVLTEHLPAAVTERIENAELIQVKMLLGHRSGIAEWVNLEVKQAVASDPGHVWSLDEILNHVASQPAQFRPGERYGYSNTNYVLLGEILSAVTGRSWRDVVRDQVLAGIGLDRTTLPEPGDLECPAPCARGYVPVGADRVDLTRVDPSMAGASGGHALITTAGDLTRFHQQLRSGALFKRSSTLDDMLAFRPAAGPDPALIGYGFGVMQIDSKGNAAIGHIGGTAGYQSFMLYVPATNRYVSGSINVMGDMAAVLEPILARVARP